MDVSKNVVVALPADLIFGARMRSVAEATGTELVLARNESDFLSKLTELTPRLAILDLDRRGLTVRETVTAARQTGVPLLAYVSHVREDLIAEAKDAGADRVIARGAFSKNMDALLRG